MNKITTKTVNTITTLEIADMLEMKHYKILEKLEGTKDGKTRSLIKILQELNLDINSYFIFSSYKDKSGNSNKLYICTLNGVKFLLDNLRNYTKKLELLNWYNKHINIKNNIILFNRKEEYFVDDLEKVLCQMDIHGIKQCHILNYYIDYYLPSLNIAIEYDENKHKGYTYEQQTLRQEIIERELGCSFVRVDDSNDNLTNIGIILNEIMNIKTA